MKINQKEDYKWKGTWIGDTSILHLHDDHGQIPAPEDHDLIANLEYLAGFLGSTGRRRSSLIFQKYVNLIITMGNLIISFSEYHIPIQNVLNLSCSR